MTPGANTRKGEPADSPGIHTGTESAGELELETFCLGRLGTPLDTRPELEVEVEIEAAGLGIRPRFARDFVPFGYPDEVDLLVEKAIYENKI